MTAMVLCASAADELSRDRRFAEAWGIIEVAAVGQSAEVVTTLLVWELASEICSQQRGWGRLTAHVGGRDIFLPRKAMTREKIDAIFRGAKESS